MPYAPDGIWIVSCGHSIFFKFTGPAKTVAANQAAFDKMIASLDPVR
jgi:hypothetical protein